ncbi:MAG: sulfotransferase domain-containing protein [Spartobacteria bacterium]
MKNIIVVGYPKSGCTWATRLVAELLGCPVVGFWQSDKKEIAVEGEERVSDFRCYKSHHQLRELGVLPVVRDSVELGESNDRVAPRLPELDGVSPHRSIVLYILRDPRDIAISAANYFQFDRFPALASFFGRFRRGEKLYRHTLYPLLVGHAYRLERMTEALLHGLPELHNWLRVSWREHWQPYRDAGVPIVRYEDLLAAPVEEASRILRHLGIERTPEQIATAIRNQSFERKKEALLRHGETGRAKFLRVGKSGQWREKLPAHLQRRFVEELGSELAEWGYFEGGLE